MGPAPVRDIRTVALIDDLRQAAAETAWIEFKVNNVDPEVIGRSMAALSNGARFAEQHFAYMVWGVRDGDHAVIGTSFDPSAQKHQQQPLEFWLAQRLRPSVPFVFKTVQHPGGRLILLEIPAATFSPVEFNGVAFIRIGSATPRPLTTRIG